MSDYIWIILYIICCIISMYYMFPTLKKDMVGDIFYSMQEVLAISVLSFSMSMVWFIVIPIYIVIRFGNKFFFNKEY